MPTFQITDCFGEQVTLAAPVGTVFRHGFYGTGNAGTGHHPGPAGSTPEETERMPC